MKSVPFQTPARLLMATFGLAVITLGVGSIPTAEAGGLRNCVEITGKTSGRVGCFELVWVDGVQRRMTFSNQGLRRRDAAGARRVLRPRAAVRTPRRATRPTPSRTTTSSATSRPATTAPTASNSRATSSSAAVRGSRAGPAFLPGRRSAAPRQLPLVVSVDGHPLTSAEAIETAAAAGLVVPINLGPGAVIVGTLSGH